MKWLIFWQNHVSSDDQRKVERIGKQRTRDQSIAHIFLSYFDDMKSLQSEDKARMMACMQDILLRCLRERKNMSGDVLNIVWAYHKRNQSCQAFWENSLRPLLNGMLNIETLHKNKVDWFWYSTNFRDSPV